MKITCFGCKALNTTNNTPYCELDYSIQPTFNAKFGRIDAVKPLEDCPKPKSTKSLFELLISKRNFK